MSGPDDPRPIAGTPTISDVARAAGVSKATVSHVLNGRVPVRPHTRARVLEAIRALDYVPAETARSLTARKRPAGPDARAGASVPRLTTVGYVSVDYVACVPRLPQREERLQARTIIKSIGGPAANVAAVAAGVGAPWPVAASIITSIGSDQESDWAAAELAARQVDLIASRERRQGRLDRALVLVEPDGRRTIVNEPSSLAEVDVRQFVEAADPAGVVWCLHLEGFQAPVQIEALRRARARGFRASVQATGLPPAWLADNADRLFSTADALFLHRETLAFLPGCPPDPERALPWLAARAAQAPADAWPQVVTLTLGAQGAAVVTRDGRCARAPAPDVTVVDKTGAGDAFVGAFLALWLNGCEPDVAARAACAAGSLAAAQYGAQEMRPIAQELAALAGIHLPLQAEPASALP
ncbi:carbohydrate kinase [Alsobacter soli]|uniref:Carbohydrate kinase n=1 Tax=Alsobacter soli TaxID=2109933 RepID=A0A2T1HLJ2_9HYPH|nr:carbohydrate kinase family protein [Alsobacter soli]PSC02514.1 carbohydrate kinase [Alsobacter soli]